MLVPGLNYMFETFVECMNDKGISDTVKVGMHSCKQKAKVLICLHMCTFNSSPVRNYRKSHCTTPGFGIGVGSHKC